MIAISQAMMEKEGILKKNLSPIVIYLVLVLLTIVAYWPVKNCDFVIIDDNEYVYNNIHVRSGLTWKNVQYALSFDSANNKILAIWHPITMLSLMLDYEMFGLHSSGYHIVNLFLHILNTLLIFFILKRATRAYLRSALVAALFSLHPLHVESVAWIAERKDVLSAFFFLLTIGFYILYAEKRTLRLYFLAFVSFVLGLMAKPMIVTLPFILLLIDYWPLNRFQIDESMKFQLKQLYRFIWEKVPFFILSVGFSVIAYVTQKKVGTLGSLSLPVIVRIENAIRSYIVYLIKTIWPVDLAVVYPHPIIIPTWQVIGAITILIGISYLVVWTRKTHKYLMVGWLWYLGTLLPVIGIIQLGILAFCDRYTYIPLIGIFIMITWGVSEFIMHSPYRRLIMCTLTVILLIILIITTNIQTRYWQNSEILFSHAINVVENNYLAHVYLGSYLMTKGRFTEAEAHYEESLRIQPGFYRVHGYLARTLFLGGKMEEALIHLRILFEIDDNDPEAYYTLGNVLSNMKRIDEAIIAYQRAIEIAPSLAEAHADLGIALASKGKLAEALDQLNTGLSLKPQLVEYQFAVGIILFQQGRFNEAADHLKYAIHCNPNNPNLFSAYYLLGKIALAQGRYDEAVKCYQDTLRFHPDYEMAKKDLRDVLSRYRKMR